MRKKNMNYSLIWIKIKLFSLIKLKIKNYLLD
jgi:hypothetical protein